MSTQINLKLTKDFFNKLENYANDYGYISIQELTREALREKIYSNLDVKKEYKEKLKSIDANSFSSTKESEKFIESLKKKLK